MFALFLGLARIVISLKLLDLKGSVTLNTRPRHGKKSLMDIYILSFHQEGIHSNKQTNFKINEF